jgi:hypothetical protein
MNVDYSKYKRVFAFGCSYTTYNYPTWADILASEMPNAEYYNLGKSGGGNLMISNRVAQANCKFKFCETDLVMVMFSTVYREDRYLSDNWTTGGNIYNQPHYDKNFVKNYCPPDHFLVRDMALVEMTTTYLKSLGCGTVFFKMADWEAEYIPSEIGETETRTITKLASIYQDSDINNFPPSALSVVNPKGYTVTKDGKPRRDGHPTPEEHYTFLKHTGITLTGLSEQYVKETMEKFNSITYYEQFAEEFPTFVRGDTAWHCGLF